MKRYELITDESSTYMVESANGEYVRYDEAITFIANTSDGRGTLRDAGNVTGSYPMKDKRPHATRGNP